MSFPVGVAAAQRPLEALGEVRILHGEQSLFQDGSAIHRDLVVGRDN
ncbi:MAG: hypothetical protein RLZZ426_844 [Actinomycetota bacterium]